MKALIICAGGMSSSMIAMKTMEELAKRGITVEMSACGTPEGEKQIDAKNWDLYLISPQTKMYWPTLKSKADNVGAKIVQIPPQAYIPVPMGISKMADLVKKELNL